MDYFCAMIVQVLHKESNNQIDLSSPIEIGIAIQRDNGVGGFDIANAEYRVYSSGNFVGSRSQGAGCNLETITFTPHGNGTHTECYGHIAHEPVMVNNCIHDLFYPALLHTFDARTANEQMYVDFSSFDFDALREVDALVIRTRPNSDEKVHRDYSGLPTPCIAVEDMHRIVEAGLQHLILDLPSVDPEWDGGALAAHHVFWNYPESPRVEASITEFAYVPDIVTDGSYMLKLNIANFESDAAPSRPVLYPIVKV